MVVLGGLGVSESDQKYPVWSQRAVVRKSGGSAQSAAIDGGRREGAGSFKRTKTEDLVGAINRTLTLRLLRGNSAVLPDHYAR